MAHTGGAPATTTLTDGQGGVVVPFAHKWFNIVVFAFSRNTAFQLSTLPYRQSPWMNINARNNLESFALPKEEGFIIS